MSRDGINRRSFLSAIGSASLLGTAGLGAARRRPGRRSRRGRTTTERPPGTGDPGTDEQIPAFAQGESIHEYERSGDHFVYTHRFVSDDLEERYGDPVIEFEPERVPVEMVSESLHSRKSWTTRVKDTQVIGTSDEHAVAERKIFEQRRQDGSVRAQTHLRDDVPLYHYKNAADAQNKQARKAPINLTWAEPDSASSVKNFLEGDCNWTQYDWLPEEPRYINDDGTVRSTDEHVMDRIWFTEQWHVRLYDIDGDDVLSVVGQAHRDPLNHNQIATVDNWRFDDAREQTVDCWRNHTAKAIWSEAQNNGSDWPSADGRIAVIGY